MTSSNKGYHAAGIAVKLNKLVLLGRRTSICQNLAGYWSVPCGLIEKGETPENAARREFFEETGICAKKNISLIGDFEIATHKYFALFSFEVENLIFPSMSAQDAFEHDEWGFFKIEKKTLPSPMTTELIDLIVKLK